MEIIKTFLNLLKKPVKKLTKIKDNIETLDHSNVINKINCVEVEEVTFVTVALI